MLQRSFDKPFLRKKRFVVDDGFSDGTADVARAAGALVMRHEKNKGTAQTAVKHQLRIPEVGNGIWRD